ncbi:MAG: hypothetical protein ABSC32_10240 [Steroidobacteraceae bacterium]|jgi:hypothetical protein
MSAQPRRFTRTAPSKADRTHSVDIRMTDMLASDAAWWDARLGPKHARNRTRADRFWAWSVLLPLCHLVQLAKRRYCRPLVVWARADSGRFVRVGMSIFIEHYPYLDVRRRLDSYFIWFMSAADPALLKSDFGMTRPPALGRVLLDNAIVLSQNAGLRGRIGLHAAAAGGKALLSLYAACGLTNLAPTAPLPAEVKRKNDGRFFIADEAHAETLAALLDPRR